MDLSPRSPGVVNGLLAPKSLGVVNALLSPRSPGVVNAVKNLGQRLSNYGSASQDPSPNCPHLNDSAIIGTRKTGKTTPAPGSLGLQAEDITKPLYISIINAKKLPNADSLGKSDAYCTISLGSKPDAVVLKTSVVWDNLDPVWNYTGILNYPLGEQQIILHVWDKESWRSRKAALGSVILKSDNFLPTGMSECDLKLDGTEASTVRVKIVVGGKDKNWAHAETVLKEFFRKADKDVSGGISRAELVQALGDSSDARKLLHLPSQVSSNDVDSLWSTFDGDENGYITFEELHLYAYGFSVQAVALPSTRVGMVLSLANDARLRVTNILTPPPSSNRNDEARALAKDLQSYLVCIAKDPKHHVAGVLASCGAVTFGVIGGAVGGVGGASTGLAAGAVAAPVTFGLSVPAGFVIGGALGAGAGATVGATGGGVGGGIAGRFAYLHREYFFEEKTLAIKTLKELLATAQKKTGEVSADVQKKVANGRTAVTSRALAFTGRK